MKFKKLSSLLFAFVFAFAFLVAGCSNGSDDNSSAEEQSGTITLSAEATSATVGDVVSLSVSFRYTKEDILESKLFGDGEKNEIINSELGDYLAIAKTNKTLLYEGDEVLESHHAGYTDDEIFVPLIIIEK